jgi:hypothetical protein
LPITNIAPASCRESITKTAKTPKSPRNDKREIEQEKSSGRGEINLCFLCNRLFDLICSSGRPWRLGGLLIREFDTAKSNAVADLGDPRHNPPNAGRSSHPK